METTEPAQSWANRTERALRLAKASEPVRLYLYSVGAVIVTGLTLAGALTGDWAPYLMSALGVVLGVVPATEAARSSVYSLHGQLTALRKLRTAQDLTTALGDRAE